MKCLRCGKEVSNTVTTCPECGFDLEAQKKYVKITVEDDSDADDKTKIILIDNPILTFIFGLLSLMVALTLVVDINYFFIMCFVLTFSLCFFFSTRPTRVKFKPVRTFGVVLGYIALAITSYQLIFFLLEFTGFLK